jgi:putative Ca2+/H+ antiporter (TMEM165/GDT1 family)
MKRWLHPWAALYVAQVAVGMLVWSVLSERATTLLGAVAFVLFAALAVVLWRARDQFNG